MVSVLAITIGIVINDTSRTMPIMRIERTIVMAVMTDIMYEMVFVCTPADAANSRSKATNITGRIHSTAAISNSEVSTASAMTSAVVTVMMLPNRKLDRSPDV